ncbi:hypothetical protein PR048_001521 [Dryococelus australis]|uniref:DDE-1 domain-containing protein n=1 Tax=Dryococelus australis TaxID=614101 RepID=A0ABQ9IHK6_9NEOP|nr:hypothetical protein PR048_001521 [Dryococelus australis]
MNSLQATWEKITSKASHGWLDGFKSRNEIVFKFVCGESGNVDVQVANEWKTDLLQMIDKTMTFKGESCSGSKLSKYRVIFSVGANMDGSEKWQLLIIGKSANRRCFKNVKSKLVEYEANRKACMT